MSSRTCLVASGSNDPWTTLADLVLGWYALCVRIERRSSSLSGERIYIDAACSLLYTSELGLAIATAVERLRIKRLLTCMSIGVIL